MPTNSIVNIIRTELAATPEAPTAEIRRIGARVYRSLEDRSFDRVVALCEELLRTGDWACKTIAFDWAYRQRRNYSRVTFDTFEAWLFEHITGWSDCDDFCTHAFGAVLVDFPEAADRVRDWIGSDRFPVRRAAAVIFILPIRKGIYDREMVLAVADALMHDPHYLVLKGYGWMLKVLSQIEPETVFDYLAERADTMPRVAFRYALEKMPKEKRDLLMGRKRPE